MSSLIADAWRRARRRRRLYALAGLIVLAVTAALVAGLTRDGPSQRTPDTHRAAAIQQRREAIVRQELAVRAQALAARREAQAMAARLHRVTERQELAIRAQALAARREAQAMAARLHRVTERQDRR